MSTSTTTATETPYVVALRSFQAADDAWSAELARLFGKRAGDVRYTPTGRGEEGTELRRRYEERTAAMQAWEATR